MCKSPILGDNRDSNNVVQCNTCTLPIYYNADTARRLDPTEMRCVSYVLPNAINDNKI